MQDRIRQASAFTMHDVERMQDPLPFYAAMRAHCPVAHSDQLGGFFFTTSYASTKRVYDDFRTFSSADGTALPKQPLPLYPMDMDPPSQTRLRKVLNPIFLPEAVEGYRSSMQETIDALMDGFIADGHAELQEQLIRPMLSQVVLPFLGAPLADRDHLAERLDYLTRHRADDPDGCASRGRELGEYLVALINDRRVSARRDDILQLVIETRIDGEALPDLEILGILTLVLFGGLDTTSAALGEALLHLSRHPSDAERLRTGEVPWKFALEEFVRYASPVQGLRRTCTRDVELEGTSLKAGDFVLAMNGAGNHDPKQFDRPGQIIIDRGIVGPHTHLGYGAGAHICLGQHFARAMMELAINAVLTRMADFSVAEAFVPVYMVGESRVMKHLPVRFTPGAPRGAGI